MADRASPAELRAAYLSLARRHHPDRHVHAAVEVRAAHERAMQEVNVAWAVLGDPASRRRYDEARRLATDDSPRGTAQGGSAREARWAAEDAAKRAWRPLDDGPDEVDPRLLADDPRTPRVPKLTPFQTAWRLTLALAVVSLLSSLFTRIAALAGAGIVLLVLSGVLFVSLPLRALGRSVRNDRR